MEADATLFPKSVTTNFETDSALLLGDRDTKIDSAAGQEEPEFSGLVETTQGAADSANDDVVASNDEIHKSHVVFEKSQCAPAETLNETVYDKSEARTDSVDRESKSPMPTQLAESKQPSELGFSVLFNLFKLFPFCTGFCLS
jgi:hypothetical protein